MADAQHCRDGAQAALDAAAEIMREGYSDPRERIALAAAWTHIAHDYNQTANLEDMAADLTTDLRNTELKRQIAEHDRQAGVLTALLARWGERAASRDARAAGTGGSVELCARELRAALAPAAHVTPPGFAEMGGASTEGGPDSVTVHHYDGPAPA